MAVTLPGRADRANFVPNRRGVSSFSVRVVFGSRRVKKRGQTRRVPPPDLGPARNLFLILLADDKVSRDRIGRMFAKVSPDEFPEALRQLGPVVGQAVGIDVIEEQRNNLVLG